VAALLGTATSWLLYAALVVALGSVAGRWLFIPRAAKVVPEARDSLMGSAARMGFGAALVLPAAMTLVFVRQLVEFRDPFSSWGDEAALLLGGTSWGSVWTRAVAVSLVGLAGYLLVRSRAKGAWLFASLTTTALATYPALSGHASGTGALRPLTISADVIHVVAAGVWVGGLSFVLYAERRWRRKRAMAPGETALLPVLVRVFSPVAIMAVSCLVVTGAFASWVQVEGLTALTQTSYGRLLCLKLAAVLGVMTLGGWNWRKLTPILDEPGTPLALRRSAAAELALAQVVLVITAILARTSPIVH